MPEDKFYGSQDSTSSPATGIFEVLPDDAVDLAEVTIGLNVATPGIVRVTTLDGSVSDVSLAAGSVVPLRVTRVWATGTTATGIRALT